MLQYVKQRFADDEEKLSKLERQINPLLDDNDQHQLSFILEQFVDRFHGIESELIRSSYKFCLQYSILDAIIYFQQPVCKKRYKDYYEKITNPIDFTTLKKNISRHYYQGRQQWLEDIQLLLENSLKYNGPDHIVSAVIESRFSKFQLLQGGWF